ncbi:MAG: hypothetical protein NZ741_12425 [Armatimonadetes bacterium]|nr:hypothetical protein [Armatimonadota bacterium]
MRQATSRNGVPIRLTAERWQHITSRHPEMQNQEEKVLQTVSDPDMVQTGDFGELLAIRFFPTTPLTSKYLVVIYREEHAEDGFVITAYFTSRPSGRRQVLWKR